MFKHRQKAAQIRVVEEFDRAKQRMYKRYERAEFINKEPSEKDLSYGEYYQWLDRAEGIYRVSSCSCCMYFVGRIWRMIIWPGSCPQKKH